MQYEPYESFLSTTPPSDFTDSIFSKHQCLYVSLFSTTGSDWNPSHCEVCTLFCVAHVITLFLSYSHLFRKVQECINIGGMNDMPLLCDTYMTCPSCLDHSGSEVCRINKKINTLSATHTSLSNSAAWLSEGAGLRTEDFFGPGTNCTADPSSQVWPALTRVISNRHITLHLMYACR